MSGQVLRRVLVPPDVPLPPPRPGVRHVRIARMGVVIADDELRQRVDRFFHWPMIVLALLVLPLLAIELYYLDRLEGGEASPIGILCWVGFSLIWLAFLVEFLIKIAIAECRIEYVRRNWLDLVIIVVPALRPLRATSIVRTSRVFKLRGVGMKAFRYVFAFIVGLDAAEPFLQKFGLKANKGRKDPEKMTRYELMAEVRKLRKLADAWEDWHRAHVEFTAKHGLASILMPPPPAAEVEAERLATESPPGGEEPAEAAPSPAS